MPKKQAFETARVELRIRSQNVNTVYLNKITPPEFLIMQQAHGKDAAKILGLQGPDIEQKFNEVGDMLQRERPPEALKEKLISKYTEKVFAEVFPGANPILPFTFEAAGIKLDGDEIQDDMEGWTLIKKASGGPVDELPEEQPVVQVETKQKKAKASVSDMI